MEVIDVRDLPEPVAEAIERMVRTLRDQYREPAAENGRKPAKLGLSVVPGTVIGPLTRKEIYEDER